MGLADPDKALEAELTSATTEVRSVAWDLAQAQRGRSVDSSVMDDEMLAAAVREVRPRYPEAWDDATWERVADAVGRAAAPGPDRGRTLRRRYGDSDTPAPDQPGSDAGMYAQPNATPGQTAAAEGAEHLRLLVLDRDLRQALAEAGIALHDCDGPGRRRGGCCLTPRPARADRPAGVIVAWTCADSLTAGGVDGDRYDTYRAVQDAMSEALWAVIDGFGFPVQPFGNSGVPLVIAARPAPDTSVRPWDVEDLAQPPSLTDGLLYGDPIPSIEITPDGRTGRPCARCGKLCEQLHFPQARNSSGVCCDCWDGRAFLASNDHPDGAWTDLGLCPGHSSPLT